MTPIRSLSARLYILALAGFASIAHAEVAPGIQIKDQVISIGDGVFDVRREARLNTSNANEYYTYIDYLRISAWDGNVLDRCRLEMKRATDPDGDDNWSVEVLKEEASCVREKSKLETLEPLADWRVENGALVMGRRQLATEDFLRARLKNIIGGERRICQHAENDGLIAGCNLVADEEPLILAGKPVANDKHVLIPIQTGEYGKRDDESALLWVSMGRQYWRAD